MRRMISTIACKNCPINHCAAFSADWWKRGKNLGCNIDKPMQNGGFRRAKQEKP